MTSTLNARSGEYHVRTARLDDLANLSEMEASASDTPWSSSALSGSFDAGDTIWVLCSKLQILAYAVFRIVADEAELLNWVVAKSAQNKGLGTSFLKDCLTRSELADVKRVVLEVRASNERAIKVYQKLGFEPFASRESYYASADASADSSREDAILMHWQRS